MWGPLKLSCVHFSDSFGRDEECGQEKILKLVAVWLDGDGSLHAEQPGIAFFVPDGKLRVKTWDTDRSIVLLKQFGTSKPAA